MIIVVSKDILLEQVDPKHSRELYELASANRGHLGTWLPWLEHMESEEFIRKFIEASSQRNSEGTEFAFVILKENKIVGRIGIYKIDTQNKSGEIGYWLAKDEEGKGVVSDASRKLIDWCFDGLQLNRIEIRCIGENVRSECIPVRLKFEYEGTIRQAELLNGKFHDLKVYSMLREEWG